MPQSICLATQNQGKLKEFNHLCQHHKLDFSFVSLDQMAKKLNNDGITDDVIEDGQSFIANALIKAKSYAQRTQTVCLADDSGICVPALDHKPGIHSARFAGAKASDQDNIDKLLKDTKELQGPIWAYFTCALALYDPNNEQVHISQAHLHGQIISDKRGDQGFGYNPVFFIPDKNKTLAQLSLEEKLNLDHRSLAFKKMLNNF